MQHAGRAEQQIWAWRALNHYFNSKGCEWPYLAMAAARPIVQGTGGRKKQAEDLLSGSQHKTRKFGLQEGKGSLNLLRHMTIKRFSLGGYIGGCGDEIAKLLNDFRGKWRRKSDWCRTFSETRPTAKWMAVDDLFCVASVGTQKSRHLSEQD